MILTEGPVTPPLQSLRPDPFPRKRESGTRISYLRRLAIPALVGTTFLTFVLFAPVAAGADQEMHNLKQGHKQQWRSLKEQQRAERNALARHPQSREERKRFKHDMKAQRRLVRQVQKTEVRALKESHRSAKRLRRATRGREARVGSEALN